MVSSLISAIRMLTIIPMPGKDTGSIERTFYFFPLVGLLLGGTVYATLVIFADSSAEIQFLGSLAAMILYISLTGALHMDGLADVVDAFGGGITKDHIQKILKDSRLGTFGTIALICDILLKLSLWFILLRAGQHLWIAASMVISRVVQVLFILLSRAAFSSGLLASIPHIGRGEKVLIASVSIFCWSLGMFFLDMPAFALGSMIACGFCFLFGKLCDMRIGGITGDCVGCANEIVEISFLLTVSPFLFSPC